MSDNQSLARCYPVNYLYDHVLNELQRNRDSLLRYIGAYWQQVLKNPQNEKVKRSKVVISTCIEGEYPNHKLVDVKLYVETFSTDTIDSSKRDREYTLPLPALKGRPAEEIMDSLTKAIRVSDIIYGTNHDLIPDEDQDLMIDEELHEILVNRYFALDIVYDPTPYPRLI